MTVTDPRPHVLLVDDEASNLTLLQDVLKDSNYNVSACKSGTTALRLAEQGAPDAVLLDVEMPGMDGYEVCRRLKHNPQLSETPILFLSSHTQQQHKLKGFEVGGIDYIEKPFHRREVLARLETHLALGQAKKRERERSAFLERSLQKEALARQMRERISQIIVHDMKSPVAAIHSALEMIFLLPVLEQDKELRELCEMVRWATASLTEQLNQVIRSADESQSDVLPLFPERLKVGAVFSRVARLVSAPQQIIFEPVRLSVFADEVLLERVLLNLCENSLQAGANQARLSCWTHDENFLAFEVQDDGPGIPDELTSEVFVEGFSTKKHSSPTGVEAKGGQGLSFCKYVIESLGGNIWVMDKDRPGCAIRFLLPKGDEV